MRSPFTSDAGASIDTDEIILSRCPMCPNVERNSLMCPGLKGTTHPDPSRCVFVCVYEDKHGRQYRVLPDLGESAYAARCRSRDERRGWGGWHIVKELPWRYSFDMAQEDLNAYAAKNNLRRIFFKGD